MFGKRFKKIRAWNCYSFLAVHIVNELKAFKKYNVHTVPLDFHKENGDNGTKDWHDVVDKMIWSFEEISNDYPHAPKIVDNSLNKDDFKQYREKIDEGLNLFVKHFEELWD